MADLKQLERRIRNLKQTRQMTVAMKNSAQLSLRRLQRGLGHGAKYREGIRNLLALADLARREADPESGPMIPVTPHATGGLLLVIGNSRGFAGGYQSMVTERLREEVRSGRWHEVWVLGGRVARGYEPDDPIVHVLDDPWDAPDLAAAHVLADRLVARLTERDLGELGILTVNLLEGAGSTRVETLFPLTLSDTRKDPELTLFEPDPAELVSTLYPRYLTTAVYEHWRQAKAGEAIDRARSMSSAVDSADEMIRALERAQRHTRQERITQEMLELTSGLDPEPQSLSQEEDR